MMAEARQLDVLPEDNPYLRGNFAPVAVETTAFDLPVTGTIPPALRGTLLRDGPNPIRPGPNHHWFMGDGMVHGIDVADGKATAYRNRWVRTARVEELKGLPAAPVSPNQPMQQGSGNVNVIGHGGRILALPEVGLPYALDRELGTLGQYDFAGRLASNMTAHPKIDGKTGELVFFGYDFGAVSLRYHVADAHCVLQRTVEITKPHPTMMHDFGVTASRVIFMDFPVVFDLQLAMRGTMPFRWRDDVPARLGILSRTAVRDEVQWIEVDPCFVYHPLNAYDDGQRIVFDVVRHPRTFVEGLLQGAGGPPRLERWTIDPAASRVRTEIVLDRAVEFPRVDPRVECHRHRYGYMVELELEGEAPRGLLKHDLETGATLRHDVGPLGAASEGVFVPAGAGEDEGYVLAVVYDAATDRSHVRIIDAQDFAGAPLATIQLPVRVPFGFHGNWIPAG
jgi:carotenoid cleavage dioxygenase